MESEDLGVKNTIEFYYLMRTSGNGDDISVP
jgi:hypothetical protein